MLAAVSTFATVLWFAGSAMALPRAPFASSSVSQAVGAAAPHEGSGVILVRIEGAAAVSGVGAAVVSGRPVAVTAATSTVTAFTGTCRTAATRTGT